MNRRCKRGMAGEFREAPEAVRRQAEALAGPLAGLVERLRAGRRRSW